MSDITVEPDPEVEHEYCGECGDFIRHEFQCEPGCSEHGKDMYKRNKLVVAIYKLDRMENRPHEADPASLKTCITTEKEDLNDICKCGHRRVEHAKWFTVPPGCDLCKCQKFEQDELAKRVLDEVCAALKRAVQEDLDSKRPDHYTRMRYAYDAIAKAGEM